MPIVLTDVGDTLVARFVDCRILSEADMDELLMLMKGRDRRELVVDFHKIEYINSTALGRLISLQRSLAAKGGKVGLSHVIPQIREVLTITRMDKVFAILENGPNEGDEGAGVASRVIPPKPAGQESVKLPLPPSEPE